MHVISGGNYHFIENAADVPQIFRQELDELKAVVVQSSLLEFWHERGLVLHRMFGYDDFQRSEDELTLPLGDLFSGDNRRVVLHFKTNKRLDDDLLFRVRVRYRAAEAGADEAILDTELSMSCVETEAELEAGEVLPVREEVEIVRSAAAIDDAISLLKDGKSKRAKKLLDERIAGVERYAAGTSNPALLSQFEELKLTRIEVDEYEQMERESKKFKSFTKGKRSRSRKWMKKKGFK